MKEEFKLSEKETAMFGLGHEKATYWKKVKDVKEFIKKLKEGINDFWTNGEGQCICPECWEHRESDEKRVKDCMFLHMFEEIDKLAGEKLI